MVFHNVLVLGVAHNLQKANISRHMFGVRHEGISILEILC